MSKLRPQSAMLTLYGDYVLPRGGECGIGSLIKLLGNFGLSSQAIRSAVSRMCRADILKARRAGRRSYYSLTENGHQLLTKGARRIFERKNNHWDGGWSIVVYSIPEPRRQARDKLRLELGWMGYGALSEATWISPYDLTNEVEDLVDRLQIREHVQIFRARLMSSEWGGGSGLSTQDSVLVARCWDLDRIHQKYADFIAKYRPRLEDHGRRLKAGEAIPPSECFVERFTLIHEYRKFPFFDPDLPRGLLPESWLRPEAAALFHEYHGLLAEKANEYFDSVFKEY
ncbi:phenylacetic acid degradation operon negative regulatory protein PaaX [Dehalococcoidia bacterium]|nr:phenylacetic acid degradation operon negative regulatory protein PaaX [Dehalococcoidia bacterium]MCL0088860.1 phenylacetic acid degradation operon negative regulatory protein PaaX [Dehalococcoidia bacterium]